MSSIGSFIQPFILAMVLQQQQQQLQQLQQGGVSLTSIYEHQLIQQQLLQQAVLRQHLFRNYLDLAQRHSSVNINQQGGESTFVDPNVGNSYLNTFSTIENHVSTPEVSSSGASALSNCLRFLTGLGSGSPANYRSVGNIEFAKRNGHTREANLSSGLQSFGNRGENDRLFSNPTSGSLKNALPIKSVSNIPGTTATARKYGTAEKQRASSQLFWNEFSNPDALNTRSDIDQKYQNYYQYGDPQFNEVIQDVLSSEIQQLLNENNPHSTQYSKPVAFNRQPLFKKKDKQTNVNSTVYAEGVNSNSFK